MQRWTFCAFWRVLLLPPLPGSHSGCALSQCMFDGGNGISMTRTLRLCATLGSRGSAFCSDIAFYALFCAWRPNVSRVPLRVCFAPLTLLSVILSFLVALGGQPMHCCALGMHDTGVRSRDSILTGPSHNQPIF